MPHIWKINAKYNLFGGTSVHLHHQPARNRTSPNTSPQIRSTLKSIRKKFAAQLNQSGASDKAVLPATSYPMKLWSGTYTAQSAERYCRTERRTTPAPTLSSWCLPDDTHFKSFCTSRCTGSTAPMLPVCMHIPKNTASTAEEESKCTPP